MLPHKLPRLTAGCRRRHQQHELKVQFARLPEAQLVAFSLRNVGMLRWQLDIKIIEQFLGCLEGLVSRA
jgi:hypothetical protein